MKQLPKEFAERMKYLLGNEFLDYEYSFNEPAVRAFRVNTDKISVENFEKINIFGQEKIPYVESGYYLEFDKIGNHPFHHAGMIYVQEPSAMAPVECLDIEPDSKILDMCASPGGKSTQLKNKLNDNGLLISNEIVFSRCKNLIGNIERLGLKNCITTCMDSSRLANFFPKMFDIVVVDSPCSGEGMFRKNQTAIDEWSKENVLKCAERSANILENAVKCLSDGGCILYSTCTFSLEENEMTVDNFLKKHSDFEIEPVSERVSKATVDGIRFDGCSCKNIHFARRFYPHKNRGEGQFMAILRHKCKHSDVSQKKQNIKPPKVDTILLDFLDNTLIKYDKNSIKLYGNKPVFFNNSIPIEKVSAFMCGVTIGEIKKNYVLPHHQFFSAFGNDFKRKIELSPNSDNMNCYLHGEEIKTNLSDGWAVVTVCGVALGGVKISNGIAKNHYPKGLRLLN